MSHDSFSRVTENNPIPNTVFFVDVVFVFCLFVVVSLISCWLLSVSVFSIQLGTVVYLNLPAILIRGILQHGVFVMHGCHRSCSIRMMMVPINIKATLIKSQHLPRTSRWAPRLQRSQCRRLSSVTTKSKPSLPNKNNTDNSIFQVLFRPTLFAATVCLGSFGAVAIWNTEQYMSKHESSQQQRLSLWDKLKSLRRRNNPSTNKDGNVSDLALPIPNALRDNLPYDWVLAWEDFLRDPRTHTVAPILATSLLVHGLFLVLPLGALRSRYFVHATGSGRAWPMLLSVFTHGSALHLGLNIYCLWSIGHWTTVNIFEGRKEKFWAAYVSAGTLSSLGAIVGDLIIKGVRGFPMSKGVGASGAIIFLFSLLCLTDPDNDSIRIVGQETVEDMLGLDHSRFLAGDAFLALVIIDFLGLCLGWRVFGHGAHLGGAATGLYFVEMGGLDHVRAYEALVAKKYLALRRNVVKE